MSCLIWVFAGHLCVTAGFIVWCLIHVFIGAMVDYNNHIVVHVLFSLFQWPL